jgi:phosphoribosyl-AMP cyclohydrolase
MENNNWLEQLKWDGNGLIPVIVQEHVSKDILMFAWMNLEALKKTAELSRSVFFSRSRNKLWFKGEESGHIQIVHEIRVDCDRDVILLFVTQQGHDPSIACHTGRHSCFFNVLDNDSWVSIDPVLKKPQQIYSS